MVALAALVAVSSAVVPGVALPARIEGRRLLVAGRPMSLKGINWNPVPAGGQQGHGDGVNFRGFVESDSELMAVAGINCLRTYEPIDDPEVLDILWRKKIQVVNTVYVAGDAEVSSVTGPVSRLRGHPAILMWAIGNEWNYNRLYSRMDLLAAMARVHEVAQHIRSLDPTHPIATVYGMLPGVAQLQALDSVVDVWGITAYNGLTFGPLFDQWFRASSKPMFLAEFGADAYNTQAGAVDEGDQAKATEVLMGEILAHLVRQGGVCLGGFIFELADEWWKDGAGSPDTHDVGGVAPGIGPFPDHIFNEEYWGIVRNDGTPRQAYRTYAAINVPDATTGWTGASPNEITAGFRLKACGASPGCGERLGDCCPDSQGQYQSCCSSKALVNLLRAPIVPLAPWVPVALQRLPPAPPQYPVPSYNPVPVPIPSPVSSAAASPITCTINEPVSCCMTGLCGTCAGDQCCPSPEGLVTCPSAPKSLGTGCFHPKRFDCTGLTGTDAAPGAPAPAPSIGVPLLAGGGRGGAGGGAFASPTEASAANDKPAVALVAFSVLLTIAAFAAVAWLLYVVWKKVISASSGRSGEDTRGVVAVYEQAPPWGQVNAEAGAGGNASLPFAASKPSRTRTAGSSAANGDAKGRGGLSSGAASSAGEVPPVNPWVLWARA